MHHRVFSFDLSPLQWHFVLHWDFRKRSNENFTQVIGSYIPSPVSFNMIQLPDQIKAVFSHPRIRPLLPFAAALLFIVLLGISAAWSDYHTNWFARHLGSLLLKSNSLRPQTGALWKEIHAQSQTQQNIDAADPLPIPQTGLPDPVINNRFESSRVPETGPPGYVEIWQTPLVDPNTRPLGDVITSLRTYQQGLAIVKALHLPDVHFYGQIRNRVDDLYTRLGDIQTPVPDTTIQTDNLGLLDPDALKSAVFSELAANIIPDLRRREQAALIDRYQNGQITQIFLHRDLGRFRGELHRDSEQTSITFEIDVNTISKIMNLPTPDTTDVSIMN